MATSVWSVPQLEQINAKAPNATLAELPELLMKVTACLVANARRVPFALDTPDMRTEVMRLIAEPAFSDLEVALFAIQERITQLAEEEV